MRSPVGAGLPANGVASVYQPSHMGQTTPVGAAEGCDLLIFKPSKTPATSYKKTTAVRLRRKAPVSKLT